MYANSIEVITLVPLYAHSIVFGLALLNKFPAYSDIIQSLPQRPNKLLGHTLQLYKFTNTIELVHQKIYSLDLRGNNWLYFIFKTSGTKELKLGLPLSTYSYDWKWIVPHFFNCMNHCVCVYE